MTGAAEHHPVDPGHIPERMHALASILEAEGHIDLDEVHAAIQRRESGGPERGRRLVARAWVDPGYRARLLADPKAAAGEVGVDASGLVQFDVLENTPTRHHVIVCTLCSCYPRPILGEPPEWYKSEQYRARVVREPRAVLAEFGTTLPEGVDVVVMDSTADRRLMVLPLRPEGTEHMPEEELATLVTRDSMIGVGLPASPA